VVATLLLRAWPFAPERLSIPDTVCLSAHSEVWWALVTYTVVAVSEETLYRGFLQGALSTWLVR
jgi:membrane protease YdiL (CAAX protease family)